MKEMLKCNARYDILCNYRMALEGAGPKLKELILDRAAHDDNISVWDLKMLVQCAYPEDN